MNTFNVLPFSSTSLPSPKPQNAPQPQHFSQISRPQTSKSLLPPSPLHQWQHFTITKPRNSNKNYSFSSSQISSSLFGRRQNTRRRSIKPISDQRIQFVIDIEEVTYRARSSLRRFYDESEEKFNKFVSKGSEVLEDLRTLVTVDDDRRVIVSCRRSSIQFIGNFILWSLVVVIAVRVLLNLAFLGFRGGYGGVFLRRRDRSLAGKEVVVGKRRFREREGKKKDLNFRVPINPLTLPRDIMMSTKIEESRFQMPRKRGLSEEKLPKWWIVSNSIPSSMALNSVMNMESQKEADRVMRAISDNRMSGRDITEDDIIQFRQICKRSGARVLIDTANARDSFYRASVDFVLNFCSRLDDDSEDLHIGGEDPRNFVSGIALSIGLDNIRAARIVSAAVAARTRSGFLQAWALEMQGKRVEAVDELAKICIIHAKFPPEESSAEMEMVARGLEKHLRREQREFLYDLLTSRCGAECRRSAAEALGLINSDKFTGS